MRHLLTGFEFSQDEYLDILDTAAAMKKDPKKYNQVLAGRSGAIMFEKPSLRTRTTFELAFYRLGGHGVYLDLKNGELGHRETIADYSRNLCRWVDCLVGRVFAQSTLEELAKYGSVPVINALSDLYHPAQAMADYLTIREHLGKIKGVKVAYVGDGNNMTNSYMYGCAKAGMTFVAATPEDYRPDEQVVKNAIEDAKATGASITLVTDPKEAVKDADIVVTDTWASMGQEAEHDMRKKIFAPYQVNKELLQGADKRVIVMHCLPAYRGEEITEDVFEANADVIFDEAENRLHTQKAIMALTMGD